MVYDYWKETYGDDPIGYYTGILNFDQCLSEMEKSIGYNYWLLKKNMRLLCYHILKRDG